MANITSVQIKPVQAADAGAVRYLFEKIFHHPMSEAFWHWKYAANGVGVIAFENDNPLAHFGGQFREVRYKNQLLKCLQCVDAMVDPAARGALKRHGLYYQIATYFMHKHIGFGKTVDFGYGFPNYRIMRLSEYLGIQVPVGEILELSWTPQRLTNLVQKTLDWNSTQDQELINRLDFEMTSSLSKDIVGVRHFNYLKYRYYDNPSITYQATLCFNSANNQCEGLVVHRVEHDTLLVLDLIGNAELFPNLVKHSRHIAATQANSRVLFWLAKHQLHLFEKTRPTVVAPNVFIPTITCTDGPDPRALRNKWWLSAGDTDFK